MWKPFARQDQEAVEGVPNQPDAAVAAEPMTDPSAEHVESTQHTGDSIAEIQIMGQTAIATFTVTELTQNEGAEALADLLTDMSETGAQHFVLDVQNVQYMDTACLGCLVEALNTLAQRGGRIALANPNHSVHYIFRLTRLDRVFRICSDVMAALSAVEGTGEE